MLWTVLSMTAALVMTACTNDDNTAETPAAQQTIVKTIPFSVTVSGDAMTRATVDDDPSDETTYHKTLHFEADDKLYITGTDIRGVLGIQSRNDDGTRATFSGDLTYSGGGSPATDLALTATLVSVQQKDGTEVAINSETNAVTVNYPTTAYCADVATAVRKYSRLTGTSTYGAKSFTLTQQTAFLNFKIYFTDGTASGTALSTAVSNGGSAIATANVTTKTDTYGNVVAEFVLPFDSTDKLNGATVKMGDKDAISFGGNDQTLDGKVYNITRGYYGSLSTPSAAKLGQTVSTYGKLYPIKIALPSGVTALAVVAYVGGDAETSTKYNHGLALALSDVSYTWAWCSQTGATCLGTQYTNTSGTKFNDLAGIDNTDALVSHTGHTHDAASAARGYNSGAHPTGTSVWFLPSAGQWDKMATAAGSYKNLKTNAGLKSSYYWSSTESGADSSWYFCSDDGCWYEAVKNDNNYRYVRACLAF